MPSKIKPAPRSNPREVSIRLTGGVTLRSLSERAAVKWALQRVLENAQVDGASVNGAMVD